ncbi:RdgB/HAM1 family non-canonical purine NTP pyrophosphatase [Portibacter lacus]|uniref:dITP/XTP pyrophosphatase n=1 Tax=Portibacter lacus TaxID=1099794 RepID=A0AA37SP17_9BACT|nr:RdgB/HAM1 family non-canonical purine NTP pyrophosphatase [Portibacter lacus]GLR17365.1 non-canonical purine NTP pyrophosphatase [Portibacter lacus]
MEKLLFATGNKNKVIEIKALLDGLPYEIVSMAEIGFTEDIPETGKDLKENAIIKAQYLFDKTKKNIIAEDTGLEVSALNGAPGVHTARYAGDAKDSTANMNLLLENLIEQEDRSAQFHTVIALIINGELYTFDGISKGEIAKNLSGSKGFGYDPIFIPEGFSTTFAEMSLAEKSKISHRGRALSKMIEFLKK